MAAAPISIRQQSANSHSQRNGFSTEDSTTTDDEQVVFMPKSGLNGGMMKRADTVPGPAPRRTEEHHHQTPLEPPRFPTDPAWSSDDDSIVGISSAALGLGIPNQHWDRGEARRRGHTITNPPFSRPPSAVTAPYQPSRPGSTAPQESRPPSANPHARLSPSPATRRFSKRATISAEVPPPPRIASEEVLARSASVQRKEDGLVSDEKMSKGKEKMKERPISRTYETPLNNDLLDPMSSVHYSNFSEDDRPATSAPPKKLQNGHADVTIPTYSSSESIASSSQAHALSATAPPNTQPQNAQQQSLQQILQTVDLSAALRLVQTLQTQSSQKAAVAQALPQPQNAATEPTPNPSSPPPPTSPASTVPPQSPTRSNFSQQERTPLLLDFPSSSAIPPHVSIEEPSRPRRMSLLSNGSPTLNGYTQAAEKTQRRRSLSIGFGNSASVKRNRASSTASSMGSLGKIKERVPDERAALGEVGRGFEEQISKVHLTLSPATLRRAQNCLKYFSLRYTPVYAAINSDLPIPNPIAVSRFREERAEVERQRRRVLMGTSGRIRDFGDGDGGRSSQSIKRSSEAGSSHNGAPAAGVTNGPLAIASFGPRRNKRPKVWEIYPDDLAEYVAAEGKVQPSPITIPPATPERSFGLGSSLHDVTSRVTSHSSDHPRSSSSTHANGSPLSVYGKSADRDRRYSTRPGFSRENSVEGSPLGPSARGSLELPTLHRASSLGSNGSGTFHTPKSPFTTLAAISSNEGAANGSLSKIFGSPHSSRDHLPDSGSPTLGTARHRHSTSDGLRSLGRKVFSKSTDPDSSEIGRQRRAFDPVVDSNFSPGASDLDLSRRGSRVQGNMSDQSGFRTSRLRTFGKSPGMDTDGYKSSGGEEGRTRKFLSKKAVGSMNKLFGGRQRPLGPEALDASTLSRSTEQKVPLRRRVLHEDSDDEEKPPRQVLVLGDEDYARLNGLARQLRGKLTQVDTFLPRVPAMLTTHLDDLKAFREETEETFGIPVHYPIPRLPAATFAALPRNSRQTVAVQMDSETSSESSTESSDEDDSSDDEDEVEGKRATTKAAETEKPSLYQARRRNTTMQQPAIQHPRNATDPIPRASTVRPRSQTITSPTRSGGALYHPSGDRVDSLAILDKAIEDLARAVTEADEEAAKVKERQERIIGDIHAVVEDVRIVQKEINETNFQQLRTLEGHYSHLRASLTRPSTSIDALWALLSYFLTMLFWLSWLAVTLFRIGRSVFVTMPVALIRWLFFIS